MGARLRRPRLLVGLANLLAVIVLLVRALTSLADNAAVLAVTRSTAANASHQVVDLVLAADGTPLQTVDPLGTITDLTYDARLRTIRVRNAYGTALEATTEFDYDLTGNRTAVRSPRYFDAGDAGGYQKSQSTFVYDGRNQLVSLAVAPGTAEAATASFTYHLDGKPHLTTDPLGAVTTAYWHACCGRQAGQMDGLGHGTFVNADFGGRVTHVAAVGNRAAHGNPFDPTDAQTYAELTARYDLLGRPVARSRWLTARGAVYPHAPPIAGLDGVAATAGTTTRAVFDARLDDGVGLDATGGVSVPRLGGGSFSVHVNSALTRLADTVANGGAGWTMGAGAAGGAAVTIGHDEVLGIAVVDPLGRPLLQGALGPPAGSAPNTVTRWTSFVYDETATVTGFGTAQQLRQVDAAGNVVTLRSDGLGRLLESIDQAGKSTRYEYDPAGNLTKVRDPNGVGVDRVLDALGRVVSETDTVGSVTARTYDREGHVRTTTDALSAVTTLVYDARGRLVQQTDRLGLHTTWTHDAASHVTGMTDPEGKTTTYAYDLLGRRTTITFPGHNTSTSPGQAGYDRITAERDPLGRVYRTRDQAGDSVTLLRDLLGRVTQRDYRTSANWPTGTIAESDTFAFDAAGRLTSAVSGRYANTTSYAYDEFGRPITETLAYGGNSWAIGTDYDALGCAFKETQPGGAVIERTFTTRGQLHQVKRDGTTIATRSYDDGGRLSQQVFANGLTETYAYRLDDQLLSITTPGVETRSYTYDANKNVTSETITGPLSGYGWSVPSDGRNAEERLTAWNRADGNAARTWTLSPVGNWTATSLNGTSTSRTYGDVHQPLSIGGATLQYDRRGMLTRDQAGRAYAWDRRGLLASVDTDADGTAEVTYLYDALGRKVGRSEAGTTRITPQSGWRTVAEFATSAPTTAIESYAYGAYIDEPLQKVGTGGTVYYHHDRRFSVTALSDASGAAVERYAYSIHGTVGLFDGSGGSRSATALANVRMYTGVERDPTSGKDYLRNRWFEAEVGFTGRDPLGHLDGASVYHGYFSDGELDPSGLHGFINPRQVGTGSNPVTGIPNDAPLTETEKKIVDIAVTAADRADITAGHLNHFIFFGEPLISDESARGCIRDVGSGLGTGGKGVVNGLGQAGIDFISLGTYDGELVLIPVSEIDRAAGYDTSVSFAKASGEILLTLTPAKVKELKRIVDAIDAATDAKDVTIAVVDCMNEPGDSLHAAATIGRVLIGHTPCPRRVNGAVDGPGDLPTSSRSTAPDAPNTMRGAPTNLGPVGSKAPRQVTPGVRELEGHYIDDLGRSQPWRAHYDEHGRMIGRTDYNAGNRAAGIPDIHHERWEYSAQFRLGRKVENHIPGEFPQ